MAGKSWQNSALVENTDFVVCVCILVASLLNDGRAGSVVWFLFVMMESFATIYGGSGCNCFARPISASLSSLFCHS